MEYSSNPDRITRDFFDSLLLETRYLDSAVPSTGVRLFGHDFDTPVMTAALSHLHNTTPGGMVIYAQGAAAANTLHWVGMESEQELEDILATGVTSVSNMDPTVIHKRNF